MSGRQNLVRSLRVAALARRQLHSSASVSFPPPPSPNRPKSNDPFDIIEMDQFQFDDTTSLGHLRLMQLEETKILIDKVASDKHALLCEFARC